jgi:hypothetical protein
MIYLADISRLFCPMSWAQTVREAEMPSPSHFPYDFHICHWFILSFDRRIWSYHISSFSVSVCIWFAHLQSVYSLFWSMTLKQKHKFLSCPSFRMIHIFSMNLCYSISWSMWLRHTHEFLLLLIFYQFPVLIGLIYLFIEEIEAIMQIPFSSKSYFMSIFLMKLCYLSD